MSTRNSLAALDGASALFVAGQVTSGGTATILAPLATGADVVVTKTGTGTYTIVVNPFKGPQGVAVAIICPLAGIAEFSQSYSGDQLTVSVSTFSAMDATAANEAFNFEIWAA